MHQRGKVTFHPVEVSLQGYPMHKEPWKKVGCWRGYGVCCYEQALPTTCEHDRNPRAYKYLTVEPKKGATHDVYGHRLPLPGPRKTREPT
jgi:hypothetical protein